MYIVDRPRYPTGSHQLGSYVYRHYIFRLAASPVSENHRGMRPLCSPCSLQFWPRVLVPSLEYSD